MQSHNTNLVSAFPIQQYNSVRDAHEINKTLEDKKYCSSVFLDISQAFDKIWHEGLLYKIKLHLPSYFKLFKCFLRERQFRTTVDGEISDTFPVRSGVPQGSVLGPVLYLVYTSGLPTTENTLTGTFADDTAVMHVILAFGFDGNFEIFILWNAGKDCRVATATVSSSTQLEPGSDLTRALYFKQCTTCQLCSIKLCVTQ